MHAENMYGLVASVVAFSLLQMLTHKVDVAGLAAQSNELPTRYVGKQVVGRPKAVHIAPYQATVIALAIADPARLITRAKEHVSLLTGAKEIETDYWLSLPIDSSPVPMEWVHFPIVTPNKGDLLDNFRVTDADGSELPTVTFEQSTNLVIGTVDSLARACGTNEYKRYRRTVRSELAEALGSRSRYGRSRHEHQLLLGRLEQVLGTSGPARIAVVVAAELIEKYAIFVQLPVGATTPTSVLGGRSTVDLIVKTSRRAISQANPAESRTVRSVVRARRQQFAGILGVRPNIFEHSLEQAARASSFHLEFLGPEGTFLAKQSIRSSTTPSKVAEYLRFRSRLGQRYSHLYLRGGDLGARRSFARLTFHERPPGSIGPATVAALATLIGAYASSRVALHDVTSGSDAVALLVALPGIASAWLGLDGSKGMTGGVLSARLVTISTFTVATFAILLQFVGEVPAWVSPNLPTWSPIFSRADDAYRDAWTVCLTLGVVTWALAASSWIRQAHAHAQMVTKPKKDAA